MKTYRYLFTPFIFFIFSSNTYANGLNDLKKALNLLQSNSPINVKMKSSFVNKNDEEKTSGEVYVLLKENEDGFHITYSTDELNKIATEKKAKQENEQASTPTLDAAFKLNAFELQKTLSSSSNLASFIEKTAFVSEKKVTLADKEVRLLTFDLEMETLIKSKKMRKYVDDFSASYQVWIANDGTPLETKLNFNGSGSAYLIFSVEAYGENTEQYKVINDRLVLIKSEYISGSKSSFGNFERRENRELIF